MRQPEESITDILFKDGVPDTFEMMRLSPLLYPDIHKDYVAAVIGEIGEKTFNERLEARLLQWVPYALKMLETEWWSAIATWTMVLLEARDRFPESIDPLFTIEELAVLWRKGNIRAGTKAVSYLAGDETQMIQPHEQALCSTLFSGVAPKHIGNPTVEQRREILRQELPKYLEEGYNSKNYTEILQSKLDHFRSINRRLVPYLRPAAQAA